MRMDILFKSVEVDHTRLRDKEIHGWTWSLPVKGEQFVMFAPPRDIPLEDDNVRRINTSEVTSVALREEDGQVVGATFTTKSGSLYDLDILFVQETH